MKSRVNQATRTSLSETKDLEELVWRCTSAVAVARREVMVAAGMQRTRLSLRWR